MRKVIVNDQLSISDQVTEMDLRTLADEGVEIIVCNRPDKESADQPEYSNLQNVAEACGIQMHHLPFKSGAMDPGQVEEMITLIKSGKSIHAFCRTGNRSFQLIVAALAQSGVAKNEVVGYARRVGIDVSDLIKTYYGVTENIMSNQENVIDLKAQSDAKSVYHVVIVGAGSGGIAVASSLLRRHRDLRIALIDPAEEHYYQPGWTMVGGGVFDVRSTRRRMEDLIPGNAVWIKQAVSKFHPDNNEVELDDGQVICYSQLIVAPGLKLNWGAIEGLEESLGRNGVTSNYSYQYAPYTWELVQNLKQGKALFTQPPMPIKCAGAPQKAMYLSCDHWRRNSVLQNIEVDFLNAGGVLFGVSDYVPALQSYIDRYGINTLFSHELTRIDGEAKEACFRINGGEREGEEITKPFDMIHVCPPQTAPDFVAQSELAGESGWLEVDQFSLRHKRFDNVWGLGDVMDAPNAKTMAAVRKQVPVVAQNISDILNGQEIRSGYDGYGSCPLTVERGKIVLAEFGYGGKILPTFPTWLMEGKHATRSAWILKKDILPGIYWNAMLKGREWLAGPRDLERLRA